MAVQSWDILGNQAVQKKSPITISPYLFDTNNPTFLSGLLDTSKYDFLKGYGNLNLPGQASTFASTYKPPAGIGENYFQDFLKNINAPSSVDTVQSQINSQLMEQLLSGIDIDTSKALGSARSDYADRGLLGPGQTSDIASNALAQIQSDALRSKTGARLGFVNQELAMQKAREQAAREAYGSRYGAGVSADTQARDIASRGALTDVGSINDLLRTQYQGGLAGGRDYAGLVSGQTGQYYTQLLDSLLKGKTLDYDTRLAYDKLRSQEGQNALQRDLDYERALLSTQDQGGDLWSNLGQDFLGSVAGGVGSAVAGPIGGAVASGLTSGLSKLKPKPKPKPIVT